jgi:hypothetical protein
MDNTVGSLSEKQQSLIIGCLLGDGYMRCKANAHLQITHSIKQQEYVWWKYNQLKEYVLTPPKRYKGNGNRIGFRFFTRSLPVFTPYYHQFYVEGKKTIPRALRLNPLILAVWFMDDGSKSRRSCYLNTQQFGFNDQNILLDALHEIDLHPHRDVDKTYIRLRFSVRETEKLVAMIAPQVINFMQYKFPI